MLNRIHLSEDLTISRLAYGMWRLGDDADTSVKHIQAKIEACLEQGITTLDQADIYGAYGAEELLGTALKASPSLRKRVEIVTKCGIVAPFGRYADKAVKYYDTGRDHIHHSVDLSLQLMGIEQIDLLLIHRPDPMMDHHETGDALDALIKSGKVKTVGVSNFKPHDWTLLQSAMTNKLVTNQIEISLMHHEPFTNGDIAFHQMNGQPPMAWSPLGGGALFEAENAGLRNALKAVGDAHGVDEGTVAVAWLLAHPARILPVLGTNNLDRIKRIGDAAKVQIDRETWFDLYTHALGREVA